jgi:hypothetical protein
LLWNGSFRVRGVEASSPHSRLFHLRFASLNLEQPVKGSPNVMPPMIPVVMPVVTPVVTLVWIVAIGVRAGWVVAILIIATRVVAIRLIAIRLIDIRVVAIWIGINISHLIPLRVGWNGIRH